MSRRAMAATSSIAALNAFSLAREGALNPLSFRTNCSDEAMISSSVAGGSKLNSVLMFLHMRSPSSMSPLPASRGEGGNNLMPNAALPHRLSYPQRRLEAQFRRVARLILDRDAQVDRSSDRARYGAEIDAIHRAGTAVEERAERIVARGELRWQRAPFAGAMHSIFDARRLFVRRHALIPDHFAAHDIGDREQQTGTRIAIDDRHLSLVLIHDA